VSRRLSLRDASRLLVYAAVVAAAVVVLAVVARS
jgi:hypothetical protein